MKKLVALLVACSPYMVAAETLTLSGNVGASCIFTNNGTGTLSVAGGNFTSSIAATVDIQNNAAGTYQLSASPVTNMAAAPGGIDLASNATLDYAFTAGPNVGESFTGDNTSGYTAPLTLAGTDSIRLLVGGALDATAVAGTYQVDAVINCVAI